MGISLNPAGLLSGQGFDVTTLVNEMLNQKTGQLQEWQQEQSTLLLQSSLLTGINSDLTNLATAVNALADPLGALTGQAANSSDTSVLTATAQSAAAAGVHQIVVTNLASAGTIYTGALKDGSTSFLATGATSGDIQLQVGGSGGTSHDIQITPGSNDTLSTLASYINQQGWGVTANVVTDATGARLALYSQSTGSPGALAITNNNTNLTFSTPSGGTNAALTIDGIPFSSATNTITGAIPAVTLTLVGTSSSTPVQLTVGPDTSQASQAVTSFVSAYNQTINDINQQFTVDAATNSEGPLGSDTALRSLQTSLLTDVTYAVSGNSGLVNLASLGINMNNDGTLTVGKTPDGQTLDQVVAANPAALQSLFQNASSTGFANNFRTDLNNLTDATLGPLNVDLAQNKAQQTDLSHSISEFEIRLTTEQQQLMQQFSHVNAALQAYPLLLQQVTETLATMGSGSNSGSTHPTLTSGL
jgi:flagellar hook-associated protein 2